MKHWIVLFFSLLFLASCSNSEEGPAPVDRVPDNVVGLINDTVDETPVVIYANSQNRELVAYQRRTVDSDVELELEISDSGFPAVFKDQFGNSYDLHGRSTSGGADLLKIDQVVGYWFFFPAFYKEVHLASGEVLMNNSYPTDNNSWFVDEEFVFAGSFRDGIPSVDQPQFEILDGRNLIEHPFYSNLGDDELVTVITIGESNYIYPHRILEYHEVVNSRHNGIPLTMSYCPLTGTSKVWSRMVEGKEVEFGVSGLLYNNNLILYDRTSETNWSQILGVGIEGSYTSTEVAEITFIEMTLQAASSLDGAEHYLSTNTGFSFNYETSLYANYKLDQRVSFPLTNSEERFHPKDRFLGIPFGSDVKIYQFEDFK